MLKRQPQRTCLGCLSVNPKREMIRIVRTSTGEVEVDLTGKKSGRGAYVCPNDNCFELMVKKKRIKKALNVEPSPDFISELKQYIAKLERSLE